MNRAREILMVTVAVGAFITASCGREGHSPRGIVSVTPPPERQELRWSNGELPRTTDPALAETRSDVDAVRALYDGLTETDPVTLEPVPAIAERWSSDADGAVHTFELREDARWSNGDPVTAEDFVRSWTRLASLGTKAAHRHLIENIVGFPYGLFDESAPTAEEEEVLSAGEPSEGPSTTAPTAQGGIGVLPTAEAGSIGVEAKDARTLVVRLKRPDPQFAAVVAHPMFRPVHRSSAAQETSGDPLVTNGPFSLAAAGNESFVLSRNESYWDRERVVLEKVEFVRFENAEQALEAYRSGDVQAVTNTDFEPLALKLLESFGDFQSAAHAAVNLYEINSDRAPFDDGRIREALALAVDRQLLVDAEMGGAATPAPAFLPFKRDPATRTFGFDPDRARTLFSEAGFAGGNGFPTVRLVVHRNDLQIRVAQALSKMWKQELGIEVDVVVKERSEMASVRRSGDFDLMRRGAMFQSPSRTAAVGLIRPRAASSVGEAPMTEERMLSEALAIPIYHPKSFSLVKPFVKGFPLNSLDVVSLKSVSIDTSWRRTDR
jgi:oligopeptide transport system substrate-binding protein